MNVLSLFDGMSCGHIALDDLDVEVDNYYASEIEDISIKVTQDNFPNTIQLGDVTNLGEDELDELPNIDMVIGGSPCQDLSIANKNRTGLEGERSGLFYEYVRVLEYVEPDYFLLENVASMPDKDRDIISEIMKVEPIRLNSALVAPALRDRYYWTNIPVGMDLRDRGVTYQDSIDSGYVDREKAKALLASNYYSPGGNPLRLFRRYYDVGFENVIFEDRIHYLRCVKDYLSNYSYLDADEIDYENADISIYEGIRKMNQRELERMQTVPEGYTDILTRNQAAQVLGNGWTVEIIKYLFKELENIY